MAGKAVIYGDVIAEQDRHRVCVSYAGHRESLIWQDSPSVIEPGDNSTIFIDLDSPEFSDSEFLLSVASAGERVRIIGKSEQPSSNETIRVSKLGVSEILSSDQCVTRIEQFLDDLDRLARPPGKGASKYSIDALIGRSKEMLRVCKTIRLLSSVDFPSALILGETGTGKSLVLRVLHNTGVRANHNLVEVNCSAIPDELFESELFGHVKGAFTNAHDDKPGLFEFADKGTLFLDEIGNLSCPAQAKLLKVLEDKKLRKVGALDEQDVSVRVVAATNANLEEEVAKGRFREDLFFRLNLLTLEIPPLRDRPEDILELANHFLTLYSSLYGKGKMALDDDAISEMVAYRWPGNIRELGNVIERGVLLSRSKVLRIVDIKAALKRGRISAAERQQIVIKLPSQGRSLDDIQSLVIKHLLNVFRWNKSEVAKYLNISRPRLRRIIDSAGLQQDRRNA